MNNKSRTIIKNFSYALSSNIISLIISTIVILIVPKLIGVEAYGYWQLYLFYASYVGFFQFGWNDGIYLRYGGKDYDDLDKGVFFSQFWMLTISQIIIAGIINGGSLIFTREIDKQYIWTTVALCMVIVGIRAMLLFTLQATNRIKEYAQITIIDRLMYCFLIIIFLLFGIRNYKLMIVADLIGKIVSLIFAVFQCKDIVFREISTFRILLKEAVYNINVGIKLMFASVASMLIIGVVRLGIESSWDVETFGKVSLTLSVSNLMMLFISAIGVIMFPMLRKTDENKLANIYITMRDVLMVLLLGALIMYYPLKFILSVWLPEYAESLKYMALIFPMCIYEGKMSLLINTYLKTLREEKAMLKINLLSLFLSALITLLTTVLFKNLNVAILSIVFILAFRCSLAEIYLSKTLQIDIFKDIFLELVMTLIFICVGWFIKSWISVFIYAIAFLIYLLIKKKDLVQTSINLKLLLKS